MAPELSRLAAQADDTVGLQRASSSHHHDLSDVLTKRDNENVQKFKDVLKVSDPFAMESHLVNIMTKAVMLGYIKEGVLMQIDIGLDTTLTAETEGKGRSTPLGPLYEVVGEDLVKALPGFHAFSGCDQTGTISGKSKVCFSNNLKKAKRPMLDAFSSLGNSDTIPDDMYIKLKRFVCQLYIPSTQLREP